MTDRTPGGIAFLLIMFIFTVAGMAQEEATPEEAIPVKLSLSIAVERASLVEARLGEIAARVELARVIGELSPAWLAQTVRDQP